MGAPNITYEAPEIPQDNTLRDILQYQQDRQLDLDQRAAAAADRQLAQERSRRETGALGFDQYANRIASQVRAGLTPFDTAQTMLQNYVSDYRLNEDFLPVTETRTKSVYQDILDDEGKPTGDRERVQQEYEYTMPGATPGFTFNKTQVQDKLDELYDEYFGQRDLEGNFIKDPLTGEFDRGVKGKQFEANVLKSYRDLFGREATADELDAAMAEFDSSITTDSGVFRDRLKQSDAYKKQFNDNYMDNYYDLMYGSSVGERTDEEGNVTKLRSYTFDQSSMPDYDPELDTLTGIGKPDFTSFFAEPRSIMELEDKRQEVRQFTNFAYNAGLTKLQGEISKENNRIITQGKVDVAKIQKDSSLYGLMGYAFS